MTLRLAAGLEKLVLEKNDGQRSENRGGYERPGAGGCRGRRRADRRRDQVDGPSRNGRDRSALPVRVCLGPAQRLSLSVIGYSQGDSYLACSGKCGNKPT